MNEKIEFIVDDSNADSRLDKALSVMVQDMSRARIKKIFEDGGLTLNGAPPKNMSVKVKTGDVLTLRIAEPKSVDIVQDATIPLDIVYEDDDVIVLNKQAGLVVHPGAGNWDGTLVNALMAHCGASLSGINGEIRPGIVHRLDKDTSGLMLIAKNDKAHQSLSEQLSSRTLSRVYWAMVWGNLAQKAGTIETQIGRSKRNRQKMSVLNEGGKDAITHFQVIKRFLNIVDIVECRLETGRTHQIRVHMAHIGHACVGDAVYGQGIKPVSKLKPHFKYEAHLTDFIDKIKLSNRQFLHAKAIAFIHPTSGAFMQFETDLPDDLAAILSVLTDS